MRRMFSEKQIREMAKAISEKAIEDDKEIISQIKREYDEDNNVTEFIFPKGILPLGITLNTHGIYLKESKPVNADGVVWNDYAIDDIYYEDNQVHILFLGDKSDEVINNMVYIHFDKEYNGYILGNSYYILFPQVFYLHTIDVDTTDGDSITFYVVNRNPAKIDNATKLANVFNNQDNHIYFSVDASDKGFNGKPIILSSLYDNLVGFQFSAYNSGDADVIVHSFTLSAIVSDTVVSL